jgi:hypothetical protein
VIFLVLVGLSLLAAAAGAGTPPPPVSRKDIRALAAYWADQRKLPFLWVLATIFAESNGKAGEVGDQGVSIGLMQVNTRAHAARLAKLGITREKLFDPYTNIMMGTEILADVTNMVRQAYQKAGQDPPPANWDQVVRQAYRGPKRILAAIAAGTDPLAVFSDTPISLKRWAEAKARAQAVA